MEKISKLYYLMIVLVVALLLLSVGCKQQQNVIRTSSVQDTVITHRTDVITLPTRLHTIIKEPCRDSVLKPINQTFTSGNTTATITSNNGNIDIQIDTDSTVTSNNNTNTSHTSDQVSNTVITKFKTPSWAWYVLIYSGVITLWLLRKPILKLINPLW